MIAIDIPGFGHVELKYMVTDFTGTLSVDGKLLPGMRKMLSALSKQLEIHVLSGDTFGTVVKEMKGMNCEVRVLKGSNHDIQKEEFVRRLGPKNTVCIGNGNNDRKMLKIAKIGIAIVEGEGCSTQALTAANICVRSAQEGVDLLLNPKRIKATLRF